MSIAHIRLIAFIVAIIGLMVGSWQLAGAISTSPLTAATITNTLPAQTITRTHIVKRVVRGRVIRLKGGVRVIRVPLVVIHNLRCHPTRRHRCVRRVVVPAHTIPLKQATIHQAVAIARPTMPVTITTTITETVTQPPVTVTQTQTTTNTTTDIQTVTVTVTVPVLPDSSARRGVHPAGRERQPPRRRGYQWQR